MRFSWTQKIATYALAGVAAFPLYGSGEVGFGWVALTTLLGALGWWIAPTRMKNKKYRYGITALVITVLLFQLIRVVSGEPAVKMGMEFTAFLLGIKLVSRGSASDYSQIVILSFMHIIAATIAVDDLSYAVSFLLFACLSPPVLALSYLRKEMERRFGKDSQDTTKNLLERLLNSKRIVSHRFLLGTSLLSLPILAVTAVLFITFPRMGFGFFGRLSSDGTTAGFGSEVELGDLDITRMDETVLLRLEPFGFKQEMPDRLPMKIRGAVFDVYEENTWKKSRTPEWHEMQSQSGLFRLDPRASVRSNARGFTVLLESINPPLLFLPEGSGIITTDNVFSKGRPTPRKLEWNAYGSIRYDDRGKVGIRYKTYLTNQPPGGSPPTNQSAYLRLPPRSDRLAELARELGGNGTEAERVGNLVRALKNRYTYSLMLSSSPANELEKTPLNRFLFTRRTGTCEHFATALTLMSRAVGIPSRLVTGFASAQWNPIGQYYAVKSRFAHSWTEVFLDHRWITVDATPGYDGREESEPSAIAQFIDTFRMQWHKRIVGYDASSQFEMAVGLWKFTRRHRFRERAQSLFSIQSVAILLGIACFGLAAYYWRQRRQGRNKPGRREHRRLVQDERNATRLYRRLERKLDAKGYPRPKNCTPLEHIEALFQKGHRAAELALRIVRRYNEIRFGADRFHTGELASLRAQIRQL